MHLTNLLPPLPTQSPKINETKAQTKTASPRHCHGIYIDSTHSFGFLFGSTAAYIPYRYYTE